MRLSIPTLSRGEMGLALEVLNLPRKPTLKESLPSWVKKCLRLEEAALRYSQAAARGARLKQRIWRFYFRENEPDDVEVQRLCIQWQEASKILKDGITQKAGWFDLPYVGLPSNKTIVALTNPQELTTWFLTRLIANRQSRFVVKCRLCARFAVRKRGGADYCSGRCQKLANVESTYKKQGADFSEWLLKEPNDRSLPPRMQMQRMAIEKKRGAAC